MATIKSYTDISQSKKLAEILPFESADMVHFGIHLGMDGKYYLSGTNTEDDIVPIYKNLCTKVFVKVTASDITCQLPCWSLAALLENIPIDLTKEDKTLRLQIDMGLDDFDIWYEESGLAVSELDCISKDFVDACVGMIVKLHKLNLL